MPSHREGYAQKTMLVGIRVSDDEDPKGIHHSQFIIHNSHLIINHLTRHQILDLLADIGNLITRPLHIFSDK